MPISLQCTCGKRYQAKDDHAGKTFRCKKCGASLLVPPPQEQPDNPFANLGPDMFAAASTASEEPSSAVSAAASNPKKRSLLSCLLIIVFGFGGLTIVVCGGGVWYISTLPPGGVQELLRVPKRGEVKVGRFNPNDVHETGRWAGDILEPLNSIGSNNEIARNDAIKDDDAKVSARVRPFIGSKVSWEMECSVFEGGIFLDGHYNRRGGESQSEMVMCVLNARQKVHRFIISGSDKFENPDYDAKQRSYRLDVPKDLSRADAAKLTKRVIVKATIKEFEVGTYKPGLFIT